MPKATTCYIPSRDVLFLARLDGFKTAARAQCRKNAESKHKSRQQVSANLHSVNRCGRNEQKVDTDMFLLKNLRYNDQFIWLCLYLFLRNWRFFEGKLEFLQNKGGKILRTLYLLITSRKIIFLTFCFYLFM